MTETVPVGAAPVVVVAKYAEPMPLDEFKRRYDDLSLNCGAFEAAKGPLELAAELLARVESLQTALIPFASQSATMANTRMCLMAAHREKEAAGGIWTSDTRNVRLQYNEKLFYEASDAVGRKFIENHLVRLFEKVQAANEAATERDKHVDDGGKIH